MTKVIIHTNENGGVSVTYPSPEFLETNTIHDVKEKDTPDHSIIVDESILPQDADANFFDAWELNGTTITVNLDKAKTIKLNYYNTNALQEAQKRQLNTLAGITNDVDDVTWLAKLNADRQAINNATTTEQLVAI
jgi:hypothetical protein